MVADGFWYPTLTYLGSFCRYRGVFVRAAGYSLALQYARKGDGGRNALCGCTTECSLLVFVCGSTPRNFVELHSQACTFSYRACPILRSGFFQI